MRIGCMEAFCQLLERQRYRLSALNLTYGLLNNCCTIIRGGHKPPWPQAPLAPYNSPLDIVQQ